MVSQSRDDEAVAATDQAEEMAPAGDGASEWYWILGLAAAFIIVWLLLRRKKAARQG